MNLLFQQHDSPTGLDGADFSVFVHGDHEQAVHHPLLPLTGVHKQVGAARGAEGLDRDVKKPLMAKWRVKKKQKICKCLNPKCISLPLLKEGKADTDGHVVDAQRNRVPLFWRVLSGQVIVSNKRSHKSLNCNKIFNCFT